MGLVHPCPGFVLDVRVTVQVTTFRVAHRVLWQYAHDLGPPPLPLVARACTGQVARGSFDPRVLLIHSLRDGTLPLKKPAGDDPSTKAARLV